MSQVPPPPVAPPHTAHGYDPGVPKRTNGPAIASLIFGVLGCIPVLGMLLAVVLGIVGLVKAKDPRVGGKGLAIAGICLAVLWVGIYAAAGRTILAIVRGVEAERDTAKAFVTDLAAGNVDAIAARNGDTMGRGDIRNFSKMVQQYGTLTDVTNSSFQYNNGVCTVGGVATFGESRKNFEVDLVERGEDQWKAQDFRIGLQE